MATKRQIFWLTWGWFAYCLFSFTLVFFKIYGGVCFLAGMGAVLFYYHFILRLKVQDETNN